MPHISQYVLRGCGSSVYSSDTAQLLFERVFHLLRDLLVGEVGQERKGALRDAHVGSPQATLAVGTKSDVSVEA